MPSVVAAPVAAPVATPVATPVAAPVATPVAAPLAAFSFASAVGGKGVNSSDYMEIRGGDRVNWCSSSNSEFLQKRR